MKILITGANGFLGQHLTLFLAEKGYNIIACSRGACRIPERFHFEYFPVELTDKIAVNALVRNISPGIIIHTAANSKPDDCHINREACLQQNVEATKNLLQSLKAVSTKAKFIYISTDFIFGENGPHSEDATTDPLNFYGESKLMAEQCVKESGLSYAIVRPVFIYGPVWDGVRHTFLQWVKNSLEHGKAIKVVSDQTRTPTFVKDICKGIKAIIDSEQTGDFHLAGKDLLSPYDMAIAVASFLNLNAALIENVTSESFKEPVQRAKRSGLRIDKAKQLLQYDPVDFAKGVELTFNNQ
ncbi:SDR family oxidoreductase [Panacibacter ginsenosidivorans]|uniref:SDR family oxidoreductase n=1 Tax=Panacibacter ginsenosidivorans TaxID=1813871 RepID=A0A5B8V614_9BACT|nr:SDR family oxidoreductase [Panacibacter ginsenosidivorans]QEC66283.1 SDR family oxidoreductase [Panacibacter ginsenosidivorans]